MATLAPIETRHITTRSQALFTLAKFLAAHKNKAGEELLKGYIDCHRIFSTRLLPPLPPLSVEIPSYELIFQDQQNALESEIPQDTDTQNELDAFNPYIHKTSSIQRESLHYIRVFNYSLFKIDPNFVNWTLLFAKADDLFESITDDCEEADYFRELGGVYYEALVGRKDVISNLRADIVRETPMDSNLVLGVKLSLFVLAISEFATRLMTYYVLKKMRKEVNDVLALYKNTLLQPGEPSSSSLITPLRRRLQRDIRAYAYTRKELVDIRDFSHEIFTALTHWTC